jgi:HEAT repeat protein
MNTNANPRRRLLAIMLGAALMTALGFRAREWGPLPGRLVSLHDSRRNYAYSEAARLPDLKRQPLTAPLIQSSADPNPKIRRYAIYALRKFALKDETVVRALLSSMNDQDPTVRAEASIALTECGGVAVPVLFETIRQADASTRLWAIGILKSIGTPAASALKQTLIHADPLTRWAAAAALSSIEPMNLDAIPFHMEALQKAEDPAVVVTALQALDVMGSTAAVAIPAVKAALLRSRDDLADGNAPRPLAARVIRKLDGKPIEFKRLLANLDNKDLAVRYMSAYDISQMNPPEIGAAPKLLESLTSADPYVAARSAEALRRIGVKNLSVFMDELAPGFLSALGRVKDPEQVGGFTAMAQITLREMGPDVVPFVMRAVQSGTRARRANSQLFADALGETGA